VTVAEVVVGRLVMLRIVSKRIGKGNPRDTHRSTTHQPTNHASEATTTTSTRRLVAMVLVVAAVVAVTTAATTKQSTKRTKSAARLPAMTRAALLSTAEKRSGQLTNKVSRTTTAVSRGAAVVLLSATKEGACELADEVVRPAAAMALLVVAHERVHSKASERAVAGLAIATDTSRSIGDVARALRAGGLVVGVCVLRRCAVVAPAYGCFTRGEVPLRNAGADLDIVILATPVYALVDCGGAAVRAVVRAALQSAGVPNVRVVPLGNPARGQLWQIGVCRARVGRCWRVRRSGRSHIGLRGREAG
jgi:hypothetical protein